MPAFNDSQTSVIEMQISRMHDKHTEFERCHLTHDDVMRLVVEPDDYEVVQRATKLFDRYYGAPDTVAIKLDIGANEPVTVTLSQYGAPSFYVPKYCKGKLATSAPPDVVNALVAYTKERLELSRQYGRVRRVFRMLNTICDLPSKVRFLWPSIDIIANSVHDEVWRERVQKKLGSVSRKSLPIIPSELRAACRETAATLAMWQMLPNDAPPAGAVSVRYSAQRYADDLGIYHGM